MNNEPVAYKAWHEDLGWTYHDWKEGFTAEGVIPLYTHSVKQHDLGISHAIGFDNGFKAGYNKGHEDGRKLATVNEITDLTNEEIQDLMVRSGFIMQDFYSVKIFVESVLRKAQEK